MFSPAVAQQAKVGERPLRRADAVLLLGELVRKGDEEPAVALALRRERRVNAIMKLWAAVDGILAGG